MEELLTLVEIRLGRDHYFIDADIIEKFIATPHAIMVYDAPPYIEGIVEYKGEMIPSVDISPLLGMESEEGTNAKRRTLIIQAGQVAESAMAVTIDEIFMVRRLSPSLITPADISACRGIEEYVKGIIRFTEMREADGKEEMVVMIYLNVKKMLRELLKGKITRPVPDFYIWRWDKMIETESV